MKYIPLPPIEWLCQLFIYDPETGQLRWRVNRRGTAKAGGIAGHINSHGYRVVLIMNRPYRACRVIWKLQTGVDPKTQEIDHKNGAKSDDRWENLRLAARWQQTVNATTRPNRTGHRGVILAPSGRYVATINYQGKFEHLGTFDTVELAAAAYQNAAAKYHAEYRK